MGEVRDDEPTLNALMARLADGDRRAFEPLFRAFHPRAARLARLRLTEAEAMDAAQTALEKVFSRASEFTPGRPVLPWFYAIAANEVHALARRAQRAKARDDDGAVDTIPAVSDPEQDLARAELRGGRRRRRGGSRPGILRGYRRTSGRRGTLRGQPGSAPEARLPRVRPAAAAPRILS